MRMEEFKQFVTAKMTAYPNIKEEILDFYYLAKDEIEEGGSEMHEINLAINSIERLIGDVNEPLVKWDVAKNQPHDISGLNPEDYWYKKENGIYYPQSKVK